MPADLDDQLRALGTALLRESDPITVDELGASDVAMRRSAEPRRPMPTRRRWATATAIATAAAAAVGIVAVGKANDAPVPVGSAPTVPSSSVEDVEVPRPLIGVTSFPSIDASRFGLGVAEATFTSMPDTANASVEAWRLLVGRQDGGGARDIVVITVVAGLSTPNENGHVDTSVTEYDRHVEYVFDSGDVRTTIDGAITASTADLIRRAVMLGSARVPEIGALPDRFGVVVEPHLITADAGHFPVLSFPGLTISIEPLPAAALAVGPGGGLAPVTVAGRTAYVGDDGTGQINILSELDDGTVLNISSAGRSMEEVVAVAEAVELVNQETWIERYRPRWVDDVGNTVELPAQITPPTTDLTPAGTTPDTAVVQQRLIELGFDPGPVDGVEGEMTRQAVWAFEKLVLGVPGAEATGVVTPEMWQRMQEPVIVTPRRPQVTGVDHVEIYLPEQVMVVFHDDVAVLATHISTGELDDNGEPSQWCETIRVDTAPDGEPLPEPEEKSICGASKTPGGIFDVDRFVPGTRVSTLGAMWNPIYFNYGIAIHGARNVPLEPASYGNVRVPMHVAERLPELIDVGDTVYVWNGTKEPEQQTREDELPVFDWLDTNA